MGYKPFDRDWGDQTYQSLQFDIEQRVLDIGHPRRDDQESLQQAFSIM